MKNKSKLIITGIVAGVVLPIAGLVFGIRSYNHYVDRIISRSVKEMFPTENVLTISAEDYCKMKGKHLEDYARFEFSGSLNPFRKNDGSFRFIPNKKDGFESLITKDAEVVVEFYKDSFTGRHYIYDPFSGAISAGVDYKFGRGQCGYGKALTPKDAIEDLSDPNLKIPAIW